MYIKKRIQELSLDQKAKLYFMGLVRKGVIDTLPEDPKAAYIRDMMDKEDPKMDPEIRSNSRIHSRIFFIHHISNISCFRVFR